MFPLPNQQFLPHKHPCIARILGVNKNKKGGGGVPYFPNTKNAGSNLLSVLLKVNYGSQNRDIPVCPLF